MLMIRWGNLANGESKANLRRPKKKWHPRTLLLPNRWQGIGDMMQENVTTTLPPIRLGRKGLFGYPRGTASGVLGIFEEVLRGDCQCLDRES